MERHQVLIYLVAMIVGAGIGLAAPGAGPVLEHLINPVLGLLLYVTFLQVPIRDLAGSLRSGRFITAALLINFVAVPLVVAAMFTFLPTDQAVRLGVLLVLLTPCVDYVIVFAGLAGGNSRRLLAATPALLILQMVFLPIYLLLFMGSDLSRIVEPGPFVEAFLILIVIPLVLAAATQTWRGRSSIGQKVNDTAAGFMVPLMVVTLIVVIASQTPKLDGNFSTVAAVIPFYIGFLVVMAAIGWAISRALKLPTSDGRAITFSGATRNSLVVLPLALALPDAYAIAAVVIVTQTLIEVLGMIAYIKAVPRLLPAR